MKKMLMTLVAVLVSFGAQAGTLPDVLCGIGTTPICNLGGTDKLTYQSTYGRIVVSYNGVQYDSGTQAVTPQYALTFTDVYAYAADGSSIKVSASYKVWTTKSGRTVTAHWELLGGSIQ